MNISPKTIKGLMTKELQSHYSNACRTIYNDIHRNFVHVGYRYLLAELEKCETYEQLDDFLSLADYRMSLQDWIDSL